VAEAASAGAVLAVLPEAAVTGYAFGSLEEARPVARRAGAVAHDVLAGLAEVHRMTVICGTLEAQGDEVFNSALVAIPDGRRYTYRKMHLPFLGVDRFATPGPNPPIVFESGGLRIGVLICYDLRFPEAARMCALDGADLIALPTNWPVGVDFHPGIFAPSRAAENHCYLLACDRVGTERATTFIGRSVLIDYDGHQLAAASETEEEVLVGDIDPDAARRTHVRRRPGEHEWDTMADRRPGLYRRLLEPAVDRERSSMANLFSPDVD
jgi:predicted amidohydrolase